MYENDGGLLSPRDAYRLMLKDYRISSPWKRVSFGAF